MFAVWLIPSKKDTKHLENIIKKLSHDFHAPIFLPHITIYGLMDISIEIVKDAVINCMSDLEPIMVEHDGIDYSDDLWKSVFIKIKPTKILRLANEKLTQKLAKYSNYEFYPHISLIYKKIRDSEKKKIIENLKIKDEFEMNRIGILKFSKNMNKWRLVSVYKL